MFDAAMMSMESMMFVGYAALSDNQKSDVIQHLMVKENYAAHTDPLMTAAKKEEKARKKQVNLSATATRLLLLCSCCSRST